jgi:hypothetical protein
MTQPPSTILPRFVAFHISGLGYPYAMAPNGVWHRRHG